MGKLPRGAEPRSRRGAVPALGPLVDAALEAGPRAAAPEARAAVGGVGRRAVDARPPLRVAVVGGEVVARGPVDLHGLRGVAQRPQRGGGPAVGAARGDRSAGSA